MCLKKTISLVSRDYDSQEAVTSNNKYRVGFQSIGPIQKKVERPTV